MKIGPANCSFGQSRSKLSIILFINIACNYRNIFLKTFEIQQSQTEEKKQSLFLKFKFWPEKVKIYFFNYYSKKLLNFESKTRLILSFNVKEILNFE